MELTPDSAELGFVWGSRTYLMGIVNTSPDSFSGDGISDIAKAIEQGLRMVADGADVLDIGGQSTRPGSTRISIEEELDRVIPVVKALAGQVQVPISVDTFRATVAREALDAGAKIINDVWALTRDPDLGPLVAKANATIVLMHNREAPPVVGNLGGHYERVDYGDDDIVQAIGSELEQAVERAENAGISRRRIIIDPGIGFGKSVEQNLGLLRRLHDLRSRPNLSDLPLLVGTSRKSVIGLTLGLPVDDRLEGTLATLALAIAHGVDMARVHDVRAAVRCCRMADAIVRAPETTLPVA